MTNFAAFKQRLGYDVRLTNLWDATAGQTSSPAALRSTLLSFYTSLAATQQPGNPITPGQQGAGHRRTQRRQHCHAQR